MKLGGSDLEGVRCTCFMAKGMFLKLDVNISFSFSSDTLV